MTEIIRTETREGRTIAIYDNGMERDVEGNKIIRPPTAALITAESSQAMRERRKQIGQVSQLRGLAAAKGQPLPDDVDLETLIQRAGGTVEALTMHAAEIFLGSKNPRGLAELYSKLISPLVSEERTTAPEQLTTELSVLNALSAQTLASVWADVMALHKGEQPTKTIDAHFSVQHPKE